MDSWVVGDSARRAGCSFPASMVLSHYTCKGKPVIEAMAMPSCYHVSSLSFQDSPSCCHPHDPHAIPVPTHCTLLAFSMSSKTWVLSLPSVIWIELPTKSWWYTEPWLGIALQVSQVGPNLKYPSLGKPLILSGHLQRVWGIRTRWKTGSRVFLMTQWQTFSVQRYLRCFFINIFSQSSNIGNLASSLHLV
jgi:hypothetical protein